VQVETIQAVLAGMKDRLLRVQEQVAGQLREYEHLTSGPVHTRQDDDGSDTSDTGAEGRGGAAERAGAVPAGVKIMDVATGVSGE
jgi:hypothetical protein